MDLLLRCNSSLLAGCVGSLLFAIACGAGMSKSTPPPSQFQLTVKTTGNGTGTVTSKDGGINCKAGANTCSANLESGAALTLTATPDSGSTFTGWAGDCTGTGDCSVVLNANKTVTATFTASPVLTVSVSGTGGGTVTSSPSGVNCGQTCNAGFTSGTQVTLSATPDANSFFAGWSGACNGTGTCTVTMNGNQSVSATFTRLPVLTVTLSGTGTGMVTSSPPGIDCGQTCSAGFSAGTQVTLTAAADPNSLFAGWSGACNGTGTCTVTMNGNESASATFTRLPVLTVTLSGTGAGTVTSSPAGIDCGQACSAAFAAGAQVTLTAAADPNSLFAGWSGACSGTGACLVTLNSDLSVTAAFNGPQNVQALNHIIFMAQENRGFDHYFGALRQYWADNGYPDQAFDGLPQFPLSSPTGPPPTNPGCDAAFPYPDDCTIDDNSPLIASYHLQTMCVENPSPSWNESHTDRNRANPVSDTALMDGFVRTAGHHARNQVPPFFDTDGIRSMSYYDGGDLNYYYFMASNFATSDRWFAPVMSRTALNRMYLLAGTSQGHAYPLNDSNSPPLPAPIIFQALQDHGITWKIYVHPGPDGCSDPGCLYKQSYIQNFTYGQTILQQYPQNIASIDQYFTDVQNGTLPQVALIEPASEVALDEHPSDTDTDSPPNVQDGARYVASIINALMASSSWKDSAFILTWDEFGGFYDHVPPQQTVSPDGIPPFDLQPGDICTVETGPTCDFDYTGYRVPLIVVSPFTKKNYVSHTTADYTAILKLIETRFNLPNFTARDAAQMDMTEFFDFNNPSWMTPPTPPTQSMTGACYLDHLP
jgi:phospholipase C